jgi:hypothetical protein
MDRSIPNDDERKKLKKMSQYYFHLPIYVICLLSMSWIVGRLFDKSPIVGTILYLIIILGMLLLLLNFALLKRCPRCSSWGTPILGGNCPKCGLRLDHSYKGDKSHTTIQ